MIYPHFFPKVIIRQGNKVGAMDLHWSYMGRTIIDLPLCQGGKLSEALLYKRT